ncbi:MAG: hypothetical protein SGBAC_005971 [Bacillariaceae sp.]
MMMTFATQHPKQLIPQPNHNFVTAQLNLEPQIRHSVSMKKSIMHLIRSKADWCNAAADLFDLKSSTAEIAITMLSRHIQCQTSPDDQLPLDQDYRCCAAASLTLATRFNNDECLISLDDLLRMGESRFVEEELLETEQNMLQTLKHTIRSPTTEQFAMQYIELLELKYNISLKHLQQTTLDPLIQVSVQNLYFLEFPAGFMALVIVLLALELSCDTFENGALYQEVYAAAGVTMGSADDHAVRALSNELLELYHNLLYTKGNMDFYLNKALDKNKKKKFKRSELQNYNVSRTTVKEPSGLVLEMRMDEAQRKKYFVKEITPDSVWERMNKNYKIPIQVGDRVIEINKVELEDFQGLFQMNQALREEKEITISLLKEEKEKRWLHEKPTQYPGKVAPKEETFRPETKVYPPPEDSTVAPPVHASKPPPVAKEPSAPPPVSSEAPVTAASNSSSCCCVVS